ncbi:hypothetical protein [Bauldia litoralis]|uniref:hypothetical protein n=1 Tax=Bauldia litoralis TaxID=665467 RepID=UPI003D6627DF
MVHLASEESKFMTGTELVIDGGYTAQKLDTRNNPLKLAVADAAGARRADCVGSRSDRGDSRCF